MWMFAEFCDRLVAHDLPDLPSGRRSDVVAFTGRRVDSLPSPMRVGVGVVAAIVGGAGRVVGTDRVAALLARHPVPVFGEYVRLVRSLTYAYVWDTWPDTSVSGRSLRSPATQAAAGRSLAGARPLAAEHGST